MGMCMGRLNNSSRRKTSASDCSVLDLNPVDFTGASIFLLRFSMLKDTYAGSWEVFELASYARAVAADTLIIP